MLYVRTEKRPGASEPEHLFISVKGRAVFQRWHPASEPLPEDWTHVADPAAELRARELEWELKLQEGELAGLVAAMKAAVSVVPITVANHLRDTYRKHRGSTLTRDSR